jgi:hypothetical protein
MQSAAEPALGHHLAGMALDIFMTGGAFELNILGIGHFLPPFFWAGFLLGLGFQYGQPFG